MSRRFGRNQRRRAREEIVRLTEAHQRELSLANHFAHKIRNIEEELNEAKRMVAPFCALFKPELIASYDTPCYEWSVFDASLDVSYASSPDFEQTIRTTPLPVMLTYVKDRKVLDDARHVIVEFRDKSWGYAVSASALHAMSRDPRALRRRIAEVLAHEIQRSLV